MTASRFGRSVDIAAAREHLPLSVFFFDVLHCDGADLLDEPAEQRAAALAEIVPAEQRVDRLVTDDPQAAQEFLDRTLAAGHEGVMAKSLTAPYEAGRRGAGLAEGQAGAHARPGGARGRVGFGTAHGQAVQHPSRRARPGDGRVRHARQDVQGHDRRDAGLADRSGSSELADGPTDGYVVPLRPEQVVEIAFDGVQASTRYPGGMALRFARVLRYRDDKTAADADTIDTVREFFERQSAGQD